ncbi:hypothetical protein JMJ77_0001045 [Colletotrichum scovillei]|uniref:Uncharacterized protein n=1 Tax=Colletotrichum scovillei TaxID=1209932 RepID=A0A9P7RD28_9PEZI|nr:hypothetical protein JMJ77_0001045 [Colletotrichum scovillei]KAG7072267.1 hypothetical protein JMJ76_0005123 [Colletotrichum scovillei]KAG7080481.1 hypothetical protein JMJ78_0007575 [Colletotrichum scovillei]
MSEIALANTSSTSSALNHIQYAHGSYISSGAFPRPEGPIENLEGIYRRIQSQQDLRYFPESNCREEGSRTPPDSSSAAAAVFTSGPSSSGSSGLVSSPPPTGQSQSDDHPSGVAIESSQDSQATESAPEDDKSGLEEVEEE